MNLVTSNNAIISVTTCIVGLLLIMPRSSVVASVRYAVFVMSRGATVAPTMQSFEQSIEQPEAAPELVDA